MKEAADLIERAVAIATPHTAEFIRSTRWMRDGEEPRRRLDHAAEWLEEAVAIYEATPIDQRDDVDDALLLLKDAHERLTGLRDRSLHCSVIRVNRLRGRLSRAARAPVYP